MALVVESIATTAFGERSTLTINKPTGVVDGDLLIVAIAARPGSGANINSVPSGWTLAQKESVDNSTYLYYKIASSEGSSWNWGFDTSNVCGGGCLRVSGADVDDPFDQVNSGKEIDDSTPTFASGGIDPTTIQSLFVIVAHSTDNAARTLSNYAIATSNPTWTEQFNINESLSPVYSSLAVATAIRPQDTASGAVSYTIDSGSAGADARMIIANFNVEPDVTVSVDPLSAQITLTDVTITGTANVNVDPIVGQISLPDATITTQNGKWINNSKTDTNPSIVNTNKS